MYKCFAFQILRKAFDVRSEVSYYLTFDVRSDKVSLPLGLFKTNKDYTALMILFFFSGGQILWLYSYRY